MGCEQGSVIEYGVLFENTSVNRFGFVAGYVRMCRKYRLEYLHKVYSKVRLLVGRWWGRELKLEEWACLIIVGYIFGYIARHIVGYGISERLAIGLMTQ